MIYFDENKKAYGYEIENYITTVDDSIWSDYAGTDKWDIIDGQFTDITDTEEYKEEQAQKRRNTFLQDFFKVEGYGYYRRFPKGYQSAVESMNVLFNVANISQGVQAGLIIFYQEPDFTKPEECTEEWLLQHQIVMPAMNLQQFMQLYVTFMTAWNTEEHVRMA